MKHTQSQKTGSLIIPAVLFLLIIASAIWLTPVIAREKKEKQKEETARAKKIIIIDEDGNKTEYNDLDQLPSSLRLTTDLALANAGEALKIADNVLRVIDVPGITREVTRTLAEVRVASIASRVDKALSEIDWNEVNYEIDRAMTEVRNELSDPTVKEEVKANLRAAQDDLADASASIKTDLAKARRDLREANADLAKARDAEEIPSDAADIDNNFDNLINRLEDDGLIDRFDGFKIIKQDERLYINGKEQNYSVLKRYQRYFGNKDISIEGVEDEIIIRMNK